jgi:hypothetical protein
MVSMITVFINFGRSVGQSVSRSVGRSVGQSVGHLVGELEDCCDSITVSDA